MTSDVEAVQAWLQASYSVQVPHDWLTACVEWIQQENGGVAVAGDRLKGLVFEQWLLSDLRELGPGPVCLPDSLSSTQCTHVTGPVALQVDSMLDVGVPLYGQLQRMKGTFNNNTEVSADRPQQPPWEPKPSRMMLLKMTDGQTEVQGMEYQPIPALTPNLQPGAKVVVHGQVKCRRGVLLLTADNLQVLGGEVDSLMETNTPIAVLQQAMDLGATHNGKHAKQNFSGRFIQQQDFKSSCTQNKFKVEPPSTSVAQTKSWQTGQQQQQQLWQGGKDIKNQPQPWTGGGGGGGGVKKEPRSQMWGRGVKQEPPSQSHATVNDDEWEEDLDYGGLLDEPMEEEVLEGGGGAGGHPDEANWEDDDDFELAQVESEALSPVSETPGHTSVTPTLSSGDNASTHPTISNSRQPVSTSVNRPNTSRMDENKSTVSDTNKSTTSTNGGKPSLKLGGSNSLARSLSETTSKPKPPTSPPRLQKSSSCDNSAKPPPAKQRKLTAMFSRVKPEPVSQSFRQQPAGSVVDLTDDDMTTVSHIVSDAVSQSASNTASNAVSVTMSNTVSHTASNVDCKTLEGPARDKGKVTQDGSTEKSSCSRPHSSQTVVATDREVDQVECQDVDMGDNSSDQGSGEPSGEVVTLKTALPALTSPTASTLAYTIRGYITTLTDRLRSCQGEQWTLACRITDGTATLEVTIADTVLAGLIGFTARESVSLRQQARKDAAVKEALSQGLQKCQQYLIEFQGLMDIQRGQGDSKLCLVHMVKQGTKKR